MRSTIDRAGRLVIPKPARDALGLTGGEELLLGAHAAAGAVSRAALYDGLVGLAAAAAGAELVSLDLRAAETYARLGVEYRLAL